jgi:aspartate/methionine/tyrosine aminotransferase
MTSPSFIGLPVILDAVYLNQVYMNPISVNHIPHDVLVGSYSKLLGINGIRLGYMATNDDQLAAKMSELVTAEYCGLSMTSQDLLIDILPSFDWHQFYPYARFKLDLNREQFQKIEKFLGDVPVNSIGMFHYSPVDKKAKELLDKAGVTYTSGSLMGTNDNFGRFNIGQSNQLVEDAVKAILKADRT